MRAVVVWSHCCADHLFLSCAVEMADGLPPEDLAGEIAATLEEIKELRQVMKVHVSESKSKMDAVYVEWDAKLEKNKAYMAGLLAAQSK
jgi:hypothetical protein